MGGRRGEAGCADVQVDNTGKVEGCAGGAADWRRCSKSSRGERRRQAKQHQGERRTNQTAPAPDGVLPEQRGSRTAVGQGGRHQSHLLHGLLLLRLGHEAQRPLRGECTDNTCRKPSLFATNTCVTAPGSSSGACTIKTQQGIELPDHWHSANGWGFIGNLCGAGSPPAGQRRWRCPPRPRAARPPASLASTRGHANCRTVPRYMVNACRSSGKWLGGDVEARDARRFGGGGRRKTSYAGCTRN